MSGLYENLPVAVRLSPAGDSYEVGVVIHGELFAFGSFSVGGFDVDVAEAAEAETRALGTAPPPAQ